VIFANKEKKDHSLKRFYFYDKDIKGQVCKKELLPIRRTKKTKVEVQKK